MNNECLTPIVIKQWYEHNPDTNAYTNKEKNLVLELVRNKKAYNVVVTPDELKHLFSITPDLPVMTDEDKKALSKLHNITNLLDNKVDKVLGLDLSSNDFSDTYKNKLDQLSVVDKGFIDSLGIDANTVNGHHVYSEVPANAKFTDTQVHVEDSLTSLSTTDALSANQGKTLKDLVDNLTVSGGQIPSDWNQTDSTKPDFIKNKPTIPTVDKATIDALGIDAATVNGKTVGTNVPAGAVFTDTVYDDTQIKADINKKVDKETGKGLSSNDYTDADKAKVGLISITKAFDADDIQDTQSAEMHRTHGISYTPAKPSSPDINLKTDHLGIATPMRMEGNQAIPTDEADALASKELITVGSTFKLFKQYMQVTMIEKGVIHHIADITETGIYEGTNIPDAPVQGKVIVQAIKDTEGNITLELTDDTSRIHHGGVPKGGKLVWHKVDPDHLFGSADPDDALGHDGDLYFKVV